MGAGEYFDVDNTIFPGSGLRIKNIKFRSRTDSSDFRFIFVTSQAPSCHHSYLHLISKESILTLR